MKVAEGIHLIKVPTPFPVGPVNSYLIEGEPLTIIDTGVKSSLALEQFERGLSEAGYEINQIQQICLTHGHVDHIGLASTIVERSDFPVSVWINEIDAPRVTDYDGYIEDRMHAYHRIARDCGAPIEEGILDSHSALAEYFLKFGSSVKDVRYVVDGQQIPTGQGLLGSLWVPGHSLGSMVYVLDKPKVIFSGDHILGDISSNPSLDFDGVMGISILNYFDSLEKVRKYAGYTVLPGHRSLIHDLEQRIDSLLSDYSNKLKDVEQALSSSPLSIYQLSRILYGDYDSGQLILALAETLDLVKVLAERKKATIEQIESVTYARK